MRLHITDIWRHRLTEAAYPLLSAGVLNFVIWVLVLAIVLLMAVSSAS